MAYQHTHNHETCSDCAGCVKRWGPGQRCDKVHDLREGDLVTVGGGTKHWRVTFAGDVVVTVVDPSGRYHCFGRGSARPLADLAPLNPGLAS